MVTAMAGLQVRTRSSPAQTLFPARPRGDHHPPHPPPPLAEGRCSRCHVDVLKCVTRTPVWRDRRPALEGTVRLLLPVVLSGVKNKLPWLLPPRRLPIGRTGAGAAPIGRSLSLCTQEPDVVLSSGEMHHGRKRREGARLCASVCLSFNFSSIQVASRVLNKDNYLYYVQKHIKECKTMSSRLVLSGFFLFF